jgi:hypothetical protein
MLPQCPYSTGCPPPPLVTPYAPTRPPPAASTPLGARRDRGLQVSIPGQIERPRLGPAPPRHNDRAVGTTEAKLHEGGQLQQRGHDGAEVGIEQHAGERQQREPATHVLRARELAGAAGFDGRAKGNSVTAGP